MFKKKKGNSVRFEENKEDIDFKKTWEMYKKSKPILKDTNL